LTWGRSSELISAHHSRDKTAAQATSDATRLARSAHPCGKGEEMHRSVTRLRVVLVLASAMLLASCARTPPEVVRLSSVLGEDIVATQTSYQLLITRHFDGLREQVNLFIDTRWRPVFLRRFIKPEDVPELAKIKDSEQVVKRFGDFVQVAIEEIERKRKELLDPIAADEKVLRMAVDEAFNRMIRANTAVTAHLNSIRKVTEFQDQILQSAGVKELRDNINNTLIMTSNRTQQAIEAVAKAEKGLLKSEQELH
jgi:hypothetical protein